MHTMEPPTWEESRDFITSQKKLQSIIEAPQEQSVFLVDLSCILSQFRIWKKELPFVTPYYAIKCNPHPYIIEMLAKVGTHFDCASLWEIRSVLTLWVSPEKIIFANPIKGKAHLEYAQQEKVEKMTFDSIEEFIKIQKLFPNAKKVLRIAVDDSQSVCKFNSKFWAFPDQIENILHHARNTHDDIYGVSFHVGSGCRDPQIHKNAIVSALEIMRQGRKQGMSMKLLDIGGGYPASDKYIKFSDICSYIREVYHSLPEIYPELQDIEWIGEPWRYMVGTSHTLVCEVIWKKTKNDGTIRAYITEWLYSCLSGIYFDYMLPLYAVYNKKENEEKMTISVFWPTCDSLDKIWDLQIPNVEIGDKILFYHIGDYSLASGSNFNGFESPEMHFYYSNSEDASIIESLSYPVASLS